MLVAGLTKGRPNAGDDGPRFALRFEDGRGLLSLAQPLRFRFGVLEALELSLGALRFPLDLREGPCRFRTRRTRVQRARVALDPVALLSERAEEPHRWAPLAPRGALSRWALTDPFGTVAFDLAARVEGPDLWLAVAEARSGHDGPAAPLIRVLAAARALGLDLDESRGALRIPRVLCGVLLDALVPWGWRVPDDRGVRAVVEVAGLRRVVLRTAEPGETVTAPADVWEHARRLGPALGALGRGDVEGARQAWTAVLERLGRPPEGLLGAARALDLPIPAGEGEVDPTAALRAALRERRMADAVALASAVADLEPCDAVAVEALCAVAERARTDAPSDAIALLEKAVARRPRDARLTLQLVEALAQHGAPLRPTLDGALAAREPGPDRGGFARDAAVVCELAQRDDEAAWLWRTASEALPNDPRVLAGWAGVEARAGRSAEGLALYDRAADVYIGADADEERAATALDAAARLAERAGWLDVAEERRTRSVERWPTPARWAGLAQTRRALGASEAARRAEDNLLEALPGLGPDGTVDEVADVLRGAAELAAASGERERAHAFARALLRVRPTDVEASRWVESAPSPAAAPTAPGGLPAPVDALEAALLARAHAAAEDRDTAGLRAALTAAERAGERELALRIVAIALDAVGDGPARPALEAARARLEQG